jgi:hypothetical protein
MATQWATLSRNRQINNSDKQLQERIDRELIEGGAQVSDQEQHNLPSK